MNFSKLSRRVTRGVRVLTVAMLAGCHCARAWLDRDSLNARFSAHGSILRFRQAATGRLFGAEPSSEYPLTATARRA